MFFTKISKRGSLSFALAWTHIMIVALTLVVLAIARPALAVEAAQINRIEPESARHGEIVTISGRGFGAKNVRIAVGRCPLRAPGRNR